MDLYGAVLCLGENSTVFWPPVKLEVLGGPHQPGPSGVDAGSYGRKKKPQNPQVLVDFPFYQKAFFDRSAVLRLQDLQKLTHWHGMRPAHEQKRFLRNSERRKRSFFYLVVQWAEGSWMVLDIKCSLGIS